MTQTVWPTKVSNQKYKHKKKLAEPLFYALKGARSRAKKKNIPFDITLNDLVIPEYCPILGLKIERGIGQKLQDDLPSIDRIDNSKGYVKGNVRVISLKANKYKGDMTVEQVEKLLLYMKGLI